MIQYLAASLALAVPQASAVPDPTVQAAVDPSRLAEARGVIDRVWPLGTYRRIMDASMKSIMDMMTGSLLDMPVGDMVGAMKPADGKPLDPEVKDMTLRDAALTADPHFQERMEITTRVMMDEMGKVMTKLEPTIRDGLAQAYGRRFTLQQLKDLNSFFASPSGQVYAREMMLVMTDADFLKSMNSFMPEIMKAMPDMMKRVQEATAHLPPPPGAAAAVAEEDVEEVMDEAIEDALEEQP